MEHIKHELKQRVTQKRYEHVLRVADTAQALADHYRVDSVAVQQAALLHDIAKCMSKDELKNILEVSHADDRLKDFHHELWHGPAGAFIAKDEFGIENLDVLNAIQYHTTGRAQMNDLEKIIFIADLIEPGRDFPGIERLRNVAFKSLNQAMAACIKHTIQFLVSKNVTIFPDSFECYNEFISRYD